MIDDVKVVKMTDGSEVKFAGKRRMLKSTTVADDGSITLRIDFVNGETRSFKLNPALMAQFAAHGAESKYGDECAGLKDINDMVAAVDELDARLQKGEWGVKRAVSALAGASILAKALVEGTGKTPEVIKAFLVDKTVAQKMALRNSPRFAPIIARLEAERGTKGKEKPVIDTDALLGELGEGAEHAEHGHKHHKKG